MFSLKKRGRRLQMYVNAKNCWHVVKYLQIVENVCNVCVFCFKRREFPQQVQVPSTTWLCEPQVFKKYLRSCSKKYLRICLKSIWGFVWSKHCCTSAGKGIWWFPKLSDWSISYLPCCALEGLQKRVNWQILCFTIILQHMEFNLTNLSTNDLKLCRCRM